MKIFREILLTFFSTFWGRNYKKAKPRRILHFQKHSSLWKRFRKRTMFFVFFIFSFSMQTYNFDKPPVSGQKRNLWKFSVILLQWHGPNPSLMLNGCKICYQISCMSHLNHFYLLVLSHLFICFQSCIFSVLAQFDTLNVDFVGTLS